MLSGKKGNLKWLHTVIPFIYITFSKRQSYRDDTRLAVAREQELVEDCECKWVAQESSFVVMEEFWIMTVMVVT